MKVTLIVSLIVAVAYLAARLKAALAENGDLQARIVVLKRQLVRHGR